MDWPTAVVIVAALIAIAAMVSSYFAYRGAHKP